jgi:hypothetical protein
MKNKHNTIKRKQHNTTKGKYTILLNQYNKHTKILTLKTKYIPNEIKYNEPYIYHTNNTKYMQIFTLNPHQIHLILRSFLTHFLKVLNLQEKDASKCI